VGRKSAVSCAELGRETRFTPPKKAGRDPKVPARLDEGD
jgi:hypothetical protein